MSKCNFCSNMITEYCSKCDKWFCEDCRKDPQNLYPNHSDFTHKDKGINYND